MSDGQTPSGQKQNIAGKNRKIHKQNNIVTLIPSGLTSRILTCTELKGHCFVCFSFWLRVLD